MQIEFLKSVDNKSNDSEICMEAERFLITTQIK